MIYHTHIDSVPAGMLIDVRQQARPAIPVENKRIEGTVKWRPEWDAVARKCALSGMSAAEISQHFGCSCKHVQTHLISYGLVYGGRAAGWVEIKK